MKFKSSNAQVHFDRTALDYSKNFDVMRKSGRNFEFSERRSIVCNMLDGAAGALLDCACGSGEITAGVMLVGNYDSVTICDISQNMLELAVDAIKKKSLPINLKYNQSDIFEYLSQDSDSYDVVVCLGLIAHTGRIEELLQLINKRLSPGGRVILQATRSEHWGVGIVRWVARHLDVKTHGYDLTYYSSSMLEKHIVSSGFAISDKKRHCLAIPFGDRVWSLGNYWVETKLKKIGSKFGSECIYTLIKPE